MSAISLRIVEGISMDKSKALDAALSQIERAFGKGSIMRLGQGRENAKLFLRDNTGIADQIEKAIRENAGLIAEQFLDRGGPEDTAGDAMEA